MQLAERGELRLDAPITDYLPDFQPTKPIWEADYATRADVARSGLVREPPVGHYLTPPSQQLRPQ